MLSIGLEKSLPTRKTARDFVRDVNTTNYVNRTRRTAFRPGEVPGILEIFQDDIKVGSFMTIEVAKNKAIFDRMA